MIYYNLTQCSGARVVYLRSTDVEQHNYHRLLWGVPDEWFFLMSTNEPIVVMDKSSNGSGKIERIFLPVLKDVLENLWLGYLPKHNNLKFHYQLAQDVIRADKSLRQRIMFWRKKISAVNLIGKTIHVSKESNPINAHNSCS